MEMELSKAGTVYATHPHLCLFLCFDLLSVFCSTVWSLFGSSAGPGLYFIANLIQSACTERSTWAISGNGASIVNAIELLLDAR